MFLFFHIKVITQGERGVFWFWGVHNKNLGWLLASCFEGSILYGCWSFMGFMIFGSVARRDRRDDTLHPHALIQNLAGLFYSHDINEVPKHVSFVEQRRGVT